MTDSDESKSRGSLATEILTHLSRLMRMEIDLARSEVSQNLERAAVAIGLIVAAVVIALTALNLLSAALVGWMVESGMEAGLASLIVGGGLALIAIGLLAKAVHDLKLSNIAPKRTVENVQRDAQTIRGTLK